jgi:probable F420-dependent oxidoreductase
MEIWQALHLLGIEETVHLAGVAEELGITGVALGDHLVLTESWRSPYPYSPDGSVAMPAAAPFPDPWVVFAAMAATTTRLRFTSWVFILPLRDPFSTAKSIATLDRLAPGRVDLGIGVGWLAEEFAAAGIDFASRGTRTDESLEVMRLLWTGAPVSFSGRHFAFDDVVLQPTPARPVPIMVGGHTGAALRRAARTDGWYALSMGTDELRRHLDSLRSERERIGRASAPFRVLVMASPDIDAREHAELVDLGVTGLVMPPPPADAPEDQVLGVLRQAAELGR